MEASTRAAARGTGTGEDARACREGAAGPGSRGTAGDAWSIWVAVESLGTAPVAEWKTAVAYARDALAQWVTLWPVGHRPTARRGQTVGRRAGIISAKDYLDGTGTGVGGGWSGSQSVAVDEGRARWRGGMD